MAWVLMVYGVILVGFGWQGYQSAGSLVSFLMGGTSGLILSWSGWHMHQGRRFGYVTACSVLAILSVTFFIRYAAKGAMLPLGLGFTSFLLFAITLWRRSSEGRCQKV